jgi:hypothetical protein
MYSRRRHPNPIVWVIVSLVVVGAGIAIWFLNRSDMNSAPTFERGRVKCPR